MLHWYAEEQFIGILQNAIIAEMSLCNRMIHQYGTEWFIGMQQNSIIVAMKIIGIVVVILTFHRKF